MGHYAFDLSCKQSLDEWRTISIIATYGNIITIRAETQNEWKNIVCFIIEYLDSIFSCGFNSGVVWWVVNFLISTL